MLRSKRTVGLIGILVTINLLLSVILYDTTQTKQFLAYENVKLSRDLESEKSLKSVYKIKSELREKYNPDEYLNDDSMIDYEKLRKLPIIFVGGFARSGTTLMRAILDVHPSVSCGPETNTLPTFLADLTLNLLRYVPIKKLNASGLDHEIIGKAASTFIYTILKKRRIEDGKLRTEATDRLCAKDPPLLRFIKYLHEIFPNSKYVFMIRDGRGSAYSLMTHRADPLTMDTLHREMEEWNRVVDYMNKQCEYVGSEFCHKVFYEKLVTNPEPVLRELMTFLNVTWTDEFLRHEKHIGDQIKLSNQEWSSLQIVKKIYTDALNPYWKNITNYTSEAMTKYFMLGKLGYQY